MARYAVRNGLAALALASALALGAMPAAAQNAAFWRMEWRSAKNGLDRASNRVDELHGELRAVRDNASGCRLSRSLRSALMDVQVNAEKLANIEARFGNDDAHRRAVDLHNRALDERKSLEGGILVQCANLGI